MRNEKAKKMSLPKVMIALLLLAQLPTDGIAQAENYYALDVKEELMYDCYRVSLDTKQRVLVDSVYLLSDFLDTIPLNAPKSLGGVQRLFALHSPHSIAIAWGHFAGDSLCFDTKPFIYEGDCFWELSFSGKRIVDGFDGTLLNKRTGTVHQVSFRKLSFARSRHKQNR
jgi:hypothetical protein